MDDTLARLMVEDFWRAMIPAMQSGNTAAAGDIGQRFERLLAETSERMEFVEGMEFRLAVEGERDLMIAEYQANPAALKRRLGLPLGLDAPTDRRTSSAASDLGQLAVRTAVRATVWESVIAIFRAFR
jgi:hypothetical protein